MKLLFVVITALVLVFGEVIYAGDFVSEDIPSDSLIIKNLGRFSDEIVGKYKNAENQYIVYYLAHYASSPQKKHLDSMTLLKLDTNKWIFKAGGSSNILQDQ